MPRIAPAPEPGPYELRKAAPAGRALAALPASTANRIDQIARQLCELAATAPVGASSEPMQFTAGGFTVRYQLDPVERSVTLLDVSEERGRRG